MSTQPATHIPPWTLGWRLRRSLAWAEIDAQDIAKQLEVHRHTVAKWLNDEAQPKTIFLREWATITGVPLSWLLEDDGPPGETQGTITSIDPYLSLLEPATECWWPMPEGAAA